MNKNWLIISLSIAMLILAACATSGSQQGGELTGKVWAVTELTGKAILADTGISAEFTADGKVGRIGRMQPLQRHVHRLWE